MAEWNSLIEEAQRAAGEQFEAAWKLHVDRVAETLESGWRENIARVVEQRFTSLKAELTAANEQYLAEKVETEVAARLDGEWQARLDEHKQQALNEEFEQRVAQEVERRLAERLESELPERIDAALREQLDAQVAARLEEEVGLRMAQVLPEKVEQGVEERLATLLPERVQETVALERAAWEEEFLAMVEKAREEARLETAETTRDAARRELGLQLCQALRVFRRATDGNEWKEAFLDAVQPYSALSALFLVTKDRFSLEGVRGMAGELETGFDLEFEEAAAFNNALESKDVVVAMRSDAEVSPYVMSLRPDETPGKCFLFPVLVQDVVAALLYVEPGEQPLEVGAVETLVNAAGLALTGIRAARAVQASSLVNIVSAINPEEGGVAGKDAFVPAPVGVGTGAEDGSQPVAGMPQRSFNWEDLTQEERELHMRAQRFARVQVAEMRLYKDDAVKAGRRDSNIYLRLKAEIDEARERYTAQFLDGQKHMRDYMHGELVETLAIDNPQLMGPDYPGPLVP